MTTKEMIAVMQAYEDGKKIQTRTKIKGDDWKDEIPTWDWAFCEYRIKPEEEKPVRMTNRQLAEWLAKGNGEHSYGEGKNDPAFTYWSYDLEEMNLTIEEEVVIRPWGSDEWVAPTADIYERDCKYWYRTSSNKGE